MRVRAHSCISSGAMTVAILQPNNLGWSKELFTSVVLKLWPMELSQLTYGVPHKSGFLAAGEQTFRPMGSHIVWIMWPHMPDLNGVWLLHCWIQHMRSSHHARSLQLNLTHGTDPAREGSWWPDPACRVMLLHGIAPTDPSCILHPQTHPAHWPCAGSGMQNDPMPVIQLMV